MHSLLVHTVATSGGRIGDDHDAAWGAAPWEGAAVVSAAPVDAEKKFGIGEEEVVDDKEPEEQEQEAHEGQTEM